MPNWLADLDVPMFVSHRRLGRYKRLPRANAVWALDSGGFTELSTYGEWVTSPADYATAVMRYSDEIGRLAWAAPQDWMCEPAMLEKTGLSIGDHQKRTIESVVSLRELVDGTPVIPVLQGWTVGDYLSHVDQYIAAGFDLVAEPLVGLGTVCRRQDTSIAEDVVFRLASAGISLHGFGIKSRGIQRCGDLLASADSMAWSYNARRTAPLPGCVHASCANCPRWALQWRDRLLATISGQPASLWGDQ